MALFAEADEMALGKEVGLQVVLLLILGQGK